MHSTRHCQCHRRNPYIFCVLFNVRFYWCSEKQTEEGKFAKICCIYVCWKTLGWHFDSRLGHVNSSATIIWGVDCFTVAKLQRESSSFNDSPPLHCLLNKRSGAPFRLVKKGAVAYFWQFASSSVYLRLWLLFFSRQSPMVMGIYCFWTICDIVKNVNFTHDLMFHNCSLYLRITIFSTQCIILSTAQWTGKCS